MVQSHAMAAGIKTPDVGIYESPELNAFATGAFKNSALVAVSSGLLERMNRNEVDGVLAHEIAHVANGDMITMTLIQGIVNAFSMFLSRVIAFALMQAMRSKDDREGHSMGGGFMYHVIVQLFDVVFMILGSMIVAWFSRYREYRADAGGARYAGREKMIAALQKLRSTYEIQDPQTDSKAFASMKISGRGSFLKLFSTHPDLSDRIQALQKIG
jgi:heat shock protein HtpX